MFEQDLFDPKSWLLMNDTVSETKSELDLAKDELVSLYIKGSHYILGLKEITMNKDTLLSVRYPSDYVHSTEITDDIHFSCWLTDHAFDWYSSIYNLDESYLAAINKEIQVLTTLFKGNPDPDGVLFCITFRDSIKNLVSKKALNVN